jgi:Mce-associated membrane protein
MPSRKRPSPVLDGGVDAVPEKPDDSAHDDALALAEEAEAEAAEAEARAAAARARAKAIRLRRQASATENATEPVTEASLSSPEEAEVTEEAEVIAQPELTAPADPEDATESAPASAVALEEGSAVEEADKEPVDPAGEASAVDRKRRRLRVPRVPWKAVAVTLVILGICACLVLSGLMIRHHRQAEARDKRIAEFSAAARQSVVTLMSLDFNRAPEDVQRIIDNSTGQFKQDFESQKDDFTKVTQSSKVVTDATVNATAVDSMSGDSAVVLVAVTSHVTNSAGAKQEPRSWRLLVSLAREGAQIKMSKVEFVP